MNNAKKQRKTIEWVRLEISSRKLEISKGICHARIGKIKDRSSKDLTEAEEIKKRQQEYTEKVWKKGLNDLNNCDGVAIHLEPNILECEVKWALGSITINKVVQVQVMEFEMQLFQILKNDAPLNMPANLENPAVVTGLEKFSFHSNLQEGQCQRMFNTVVFTSYAIKVVLKSSSGQASAIPKPRTPRYTSQVSKRQRYQTSNCQPSMDHGERQCQENIYFC